MPTVYEDQGPFHQDTYVEPHWTYNNTDDGFAFSADHWAMKTGNEFISDQTGSSRGTKSVLHTKRSFEHRNISSTIEYTSDHYYDRTGSNSYLYSWGLRGDLNHSNISITYPKTHSMLFLEAKHKFFNSNEVDNLVNIVESGQIASGARSIVEFLFSKKRVPLLEASNAYLAWNFGFAPLIADIQKVNSAMLSLKQAIKTAVRNSGKPVTVTASCVGTISGTLVGDLGTGYSVDSNNNDGSWWHAGINPLMIPKRIVGVRGVRTIHFNSKSLGTLDYLVNRFISAGPASFIWEKIPYSFIVDWFFNLSSIVDTMDNVLTGMSKHIDNTWQSEKWSVLVPIYKHKYNGWTSNVDGQQIALNELSYYRRDPATGLSIDESRRFGKKQASLLVALLHQLVASLRGR